MTYIPTTNGIMNAFQAAAGIAGKTGAFVLTLCREVVIAGFDWAGSFIRVAEQDPLDTRGISEQLVVTGLTTVIDVDNHWYINHAFQQHLSLQTIMSDGTATDQLSLAIWGSNQSGVAPASITDWSDITTDVTGLAAITNNAGAVSRIDVVDTSHQYEWIDFRYRRTAGAANNGNITMRERRWY